MCWHPLLRCWDGVVLRWLLHSQHKLRGSAAYSSPLGCSNARYIWPHQNQEAINGNVVCVASGWTCRKNKHPKTSLIWSYFTPKLADLSNSQLTWDLPTNVLSRPSSSLTWQAALKLSYRNPGAHTRTATAQRSGSVCQLPPLWALSYNHSRKLIIVFDY